MKRRIRSIERLPGAKPLGEADPLAAYLRTRSANEIEFLAVEAVGPDAAAFAAEALKRETAKMLAARERHAQGLVGFLNDAHGLAALAGVAAGNPLAIHRGSGNINKLQETSLTNFLAAELGISGLRKRLSMRQMRIFTQFGPYGDPGLIQMQYDNTAGKWPETMVVVSVHDSNGFVNVKTGRPFAGGADLSDIPEAVEAIMQDAQLVADGMLEDYTRIPGGA